MKKNLFPVFLSMVNTVFFLINIFQKISQLLFSILNNYSIYKLFTVIHTLMDTRKDTYPYLWCILNAGKDNDLSESTIRKGKPLSFHRPTHPQPFLTPLLPFPHAELAARLVQG